MRTVALKMGRMRGEKGRRERGREEAVRVEGGSHRIEPCNDE